MSELIREMLFKKKITIKTYDASLSEVKEEPKGIKKELYSIGVNINQVTHYFHGHPDPSSEKAVLRQKIAYLFSSMEAKIEKLTNMISDLGKRWSRR